MSRWFNAGQIQARNTLIIISFRQWTIIIYHKKASLMHQNIWGKTVSPRLFPPFLTGKIHHRLIRVESIRKVFDTVSVEFSLKKQTAGQSLFHLNQVPVFCFFLTKKLILIKISVLKHLAAQLDLSIFVISSDVFIFMVHILKVCLLLQISHPLFNWRLFLMLRLIGLACLKPACCVWGSGKHYPSDLKTSWGLINGSDSQMFSLLTNK